jgi:hypothetical protein
VEENGRSAAKEGESREVAADVSLATLLADWRAAERDTAAAKSAASVAALAESAAAAAAEASSEATTAANAANQAARRASDAANVARKAAQSLSDDSVMASAKAGGDRVRAKEAVTEAEGAERVARVRYHTAEPAKFGGTPSPDETRGDD